MGGKDVLYIAQDAHDSTVFDRGSRACMGILEVSGLDVVVQNVDVLQQKSVPLPEWLTGTPSYVDVAAKQVYRGTHAIQRLREKVSEAEDAAEQQAAPDAPPPKTDVVEGMTAPGQRFVTSDDDTGDPLTDIPSAQASGGSVREGSVTESELQAFMQQREAAMPSGGGQQQTQ